MGSAASLQPIEVASFSPVREAVFTRLRQAIVSGELAPGSRLVERELAAQLGVSRTPVREAFRKLEHEGLVGQAGRKSLVVRQLSRDEVREILAIRANLEGLAAELAAEHARPTHLRSFRGLLTRMDRAAAAGDTTALAELNERFNATLYAAAGSRRLTEMLGSLREQAAKFARRGYEVPGRAAEAVREHHRIVDAVASGDREAAAREAREHVRRSEANLLAGWAEVAGGRPGASAAMAAATGGSGTEGSASEGAEPGSRGTASGSAAGGGPAESGPVGAAGSRTASGVAAVTRPVGSASTAAGAGGSGTATGAAVATEAPGRASAPTRPAGSGTANSRAAATRPAGSASAPGQRWQSASGDPAAQSPP